MELNKKKTGVNEDLFYNELYIRRPFHSIRYDSAYELLLNNIDRVPIEEIENLNKKYNLL